MGVGGGGGAKVLCILRHWGAHLRLAYSWARPAILAAGKGRGECFYLFCFLTLIHFPFSPVPLFDLLYYLFYLYLSSPFLWETTQNDPQGLTLNPNTISCPPFFKCFKYLIAGKTCTCLQKLSPFANSDVCICIPFTFYCNVCFVTT